MLKHYLDLPLEQTIISLNSQPVVVSNFPQLNDIVSLHSYTTVGSQPHNPRTHERCPDQRPSLSLSSFSVFTLKQNPINSREKKEKNLQWSRTIWSSSSPSDVVVSSSPPFVPPQLTFTSLSDSETTTLTAANPSPPHQEHSDFHRN
ncbi:hypothetical protein CsSME_00044476 [Camellia sinensis var. sinensis]